MRILTLIVGVFAVLACAIAAPTAARAEDAAGDWTGTLHVGVDLRLALHLRKTAAGYEGTADSPDQGAGDIPLTNIVSDGSSLAFDMPVAHAHYQAHWDAGQGAWVGVWNQGSDLPLTFKRGAFPAPTVISGLDGDWDGSLVTPTKALRLALHIKTDRFGTHAAMDSVDQLAMGIPSSNLTRDGAKVRFEIKPVAGVFEGEISADGATLKGTWTQGSTPLPLTFNRRAAGAPQAELRRPQTPKPPFPYEVQDVSFPGGAPGVTIAGTLTRPKGAGPFPAVILVSGSGPNARDETIIGHAIFWVLADDLTRKGYAVLRYDKRGIGQSTGDYGRATTRDFAQDAEAAVNFLHTRSDIDGRHVGLVGHSEGGLVVPIVAADNPAVAFVVLLAGPGVDGAHILDLQGRLIAAAMGEPKARIEARARLNTKIYAAEADAASTADAAARVRKVLAGQTLVPPAQADAVVAQLTSDWFRYFLSYDPVATLRRLRCPILVLNGSKDLQVPPSQNLPPIRAALVRNPQATIEELPGLNHLFQTATTGSPGEYAEIEETLSPVLLRRLSDWLATVAPPKPS